MTQTDFENQLREHIERRPFQPFLVEFEDGRSLPVVAADQLSVRLHTATTFFAGEWLSLDEETVRHIRPLTPKELQALHDLEKHLRAFKYNAPFQPFVIEFANGRSLLIDDPDALGFVAGTLSFITPAYDIVAFPYGDVRNMRLAASERAS